MHPTVTHLLCQERIDCLMVLSQSLPYSSPSHCFSQMFGHGNDKVNLNPCLYILLILEMLCTFFPMWRSAPWWSLKGIPPIPCSSFLLEFGKVWNSCPFHVAELLAMREICPTNSPLISSAQQLTPLCLLVCCHKLHLSFSLPVLWLDSNSRCIRCVQLYSYTILQNSYT